MKSYLIFCTAYFFGALLCLSQIPVTDFNSASSACLSQQLELKNNSSGASAYEWDFCSNDSETLLVNEDLATIVGLSGGYGYKVVNDGDQWYGFIVSQNNHTLYRLDFGNSPLNIPVVSNLGNPGSLFSYPNGIEIYFHSGNWYGFVGLYDSNGGVVRLDFGSALTNVPVAQNLGMFGLTGRFWGVRVVEQGGDLVLVIINRNTNSIVRVNYRDSFDNAINNASHVFSNSIAGANLTPGFDIVKSGSDWIAIVASDQNNSVIQIKFTNDILSVPSIEGSYTTGITRPLQIKLLKEGVHFIAAVTSEFTNLKIIDFKDLNPSNLPTEIPHAGLPSLLSVDAIRYKGKSILQGVGSTTRLKNLVFQSTCGASNAFSEGFEPSEIMYSTSGLKNIELRSFNEFGNSAQAQTISIANDVAPDIEFLTDGAVCSGHNILFTEINGSGGVTDYLWAFGDTNTSTDQNPTHQYNATGDYDVSLQVTAVNGCNNFVEKIISIFEEPAADFLIPSSSPFCTNENYVFENTSVIDPGYPVTWQWNVNGVNQSTDENFNFSFSQTTSQEITLQASIPGCSNSIMKAIASLIEGPLTDFSFVGHCEDDIVIFTNSSSGSIIDYNWNFDDGQNSTDTNPTHTFSDKGVYDVTLTASNLAGCNNTKTKSILIYSKPQVNFFLSPPPFSCNGMPSQFNDLTPNPIDSNLSSWQWNFGDAGSGQNTASVKNSEHVYDNAGNYDVSLTVSTNFLCSSTLQLPVTISPSPIASFSFTATCEDSVINFTDASVGTILLWDWQIGSSFYTTQNPTHTFTNPLSTNATLNVTGSNNCINSISKPIVVPAKLIPDFSFSQNCIEQQTLFTDVTNTTADPVSAYDWDFEGLGTSTGSPVNFTFSTTGSKNVTLTLTTQTGCEYFITKPVTIGLPPQADFAASPDTGAPPLAVQFTNASSGATSYGWIFNDSENTTSSETSPVFTFQQLGEYDVSLIAYNAVNCSDTISQLILVTPVTGLEVEGNFYFKMPYPNPTNENLFLGWTDRQAGSLSIRVLDIFGKQVLASEFSSIAGSNETSLNLNGLQAGVYFLQMQLGQRKRIFRVVVNPE